MSTKASHQPERSPLYAYIPISQSKVDVEALYQKPKKQRRQQPSRVEKIEEEPEVKGDNGDTNKVNCGAPTPTTTTTAVVKAPEGTALAAKRLAPLAEQVELRVESAIN